MSTARTAERQERTLRRWLELRTDAALAEACEAWDPLACSWAAHYLRSVRSARLELSDLRQEARLGLISGLHRYNPRRGVKFITYGSWRIRGAIAHAIRSTHYFIRPPVHLLESRSTARKMRLDTPEEIAAAFEVSVERAREIVDLFAVIEPMSLTFIRTRGRKDYRAEFERGELDVQIENIVARETVQSVLQRLRPVDREVLERLYLDGVTLDTVAAEAGVTRQAVCGRKQAALTAARRVLG